MTTTTDVERAFAAVIHGYYRDPRPTQAALALTGTLALLASAPPEEFGRFGPLIYLFGRIAREADDARAALAEVVATYRGPDAPLVERIVEVDAPGFPDALTLPIEDPIHLDLLWAEFFATGRRDAVARLVGVLDGTDRVRAHVGAWLAERRWFAGGRRRAHAAALAAVGLDVDLTTRAIRTDGDLDLWAWRAAEQGVQVFPVLGLAPADLLALAFKGSALWSLRLNTRDHPLVAELCRAEAERPGGAGRRALREPVPADATPFRL
ncbi:MAG: hypothetical protein IPL61_27360 [Myxococcales bacterium]|nr:hypothetical protein [Myxococcales bacterium]